MSAKKNTRNAALDTWNGPHRNALFFLLIRATVAKGTWAAWQRLYDTGRKVVETAYRLLKDDQRRICEDVAVRKKAFSPPWKAEVGPRLNKAWKHRYQELPPAVQNVMPAGAFLDWYKSVGAVADLKPGRFEEMVATGGMQWLAEQIANLRRRSHARGGRAERAAYYADGDNLLSQIAETTLLFEQALAEGSQPDLTAASRIFHPGREEQHFEPSKTSLDQQAHEDGSTLAELRESEQPEPGTRADWAERADQVGVSDAARAAREAQSASNLRRAAIVPGTMRAVRTVAAEIARRSKRGSALRWAARHYCAFKLKETKLRELSSQSGLAVSTLSDAMKDVGARIACDERVRLLAS